MGGNEIIAIRSDPYAGELAWRGCVALADCRAVLLHLLHVVVGGDGVGQRDNHKHIIFLLVILRGVQGLFVFCACASFFY